MSVAIEFAIRDQRVDVRLAGAEHVLDDEVQIFIVAVGGDSLSHFASRLPFAVGRCDFDCDVHVLPSTIFFRKAELCRS